MRQHFARAAAIALAVLGCRTAPPKKAAAPPRRTVADPEKCAGCPSFAPQPGSVIAEVDDTPVLALETPRFAQLGRDQRLLAYWTSQAAAAGDSVALDQGYRYNLPIARVLRGILSRPQVVPATLLPRIQAYARVFWLNR